jgi:hypothetical protein
MSNNSTSGLTSIIVPCWNLLEFTQLRYPGAIYHLMARGNGRQDAVCDDVDRERLQEQLGKTGKTCCLSSRELNASPVSTKHLVDKGRLSQLRGLVLSYTLQFFANIRHGRLF